VTDRFADYKRTRDRALRDALVAEHRDLAHAIASRYMGRGEPSDELEQVALIGLLKAIERFDPDMGVPFGGFATPTIRGELKRHFRDRTWSVRVPRRLQELRVDVRTAADTLAQTLGRSPTVREVAESMGETPDTVLEAMAASSAYRSQSLQASTSDDGPTAADRLASEDDDHERAELRLMIRDGMATLPEREAEIVRLRFEEDLTQSEIAEAIGISQMHVSRLLRRALLSLRAALGPTEDESP